MATDAEFRKSQKDANDLWCENNPDYWKTRNSNKSKQKKAKELDIPSSIDLQKTTSSTISEGDSTLKTDSIKIDASEQISAIIPGVYWISQNPIKIDASMQKCLIIPNNYADLSR